MNETIDRPNLSEIAAVAIRNMIVEGRLGSGAKISEENIAKELGISRTPIKIALTRLAKEGMVDLIPRRGAFVRRFSMTEYIEIYEIREMIEGIAARLAAVRITKEKLDRLVSINEAYGKTIEEILSTGALESGLLYARKRKLDIEFHRAILEAAGNRFLLQFSGVQLIELQSFLYKNALIPDEAHVRICGEHKEIIEAIRNGDRDKAEQVSREHIVKALRLLENRLSEKKKQETVFIGS